MMTAAIHNPPIARVQEPRSPFSDIEDRGESLRIDLAGSAGFEAGAARPAETSDRPVQTVEPLVQQQRN